MRARQLLLALTVAVGVAGALTACAPRSEPTASCSAAMRSAAALTDLSDDSRLLTTLAACQDEDDWLAAITRHPGPGTLQHPARSDAVELLEILCSERHGGSVCTDAEQRGDIEG